jgi:hypothetical protein
MFLQYKGVKPRDRLERLQEEEVENVTLNNIEGLTERKQKDNKRATYDK